MRLNSKQLKRPARQAMRAAVPSALLTTLLFWLLTDALDTAVTLFAPDASLDALSASLTGQGADGWTAMFLSILLTLYLVVMRFGYRAWALRTARGEQTGFGCLLDGFGMAGRVLVMQMHIFLRMFLWCIACTAVLAGVLTSVFLFLDLDPYLLYLLVWLVIPLVYLAVLLLTLRYSLSAYLLWDYPDAGPGTAVRRSAEMMRGNVWRLFRLYLSFWLWFLASFAISSAVEAALLLPDADAIRQLLALQDYTGMIALVQQTLNAPAARILSLLAALPLSLLLSPYFHLSLANFYRDLSRETVEPAFSGESF